jgi:Mor family transcriptional regulator
MNDATDSINPISVLTLEAKDLPGELKDIADVIGVDNTIKLAHAFRGCRIYICNLDPLIRKDRNIKIRSAYDQGERVITLARKHNLSTRQIESILNTLDKE